MHANYRHGFGRYGTRELVCVLEGGDAFADARFVRRTRAICMYLAAYIPRWFGRSVTETRAQCCRKGYIRALAGIFAINWNALVN